MTWDELFEKQFKVVDVFNEQKSKERKLLEAEPNTSKKDIDSFDVQWKKDREDLYEKHKKEAEQYLDQREAEAKVLTTFKRMAKEHPENEYWAEAVARKEKELKHKREEELRCYNERKKTSSKDHDR